MAGRARRSPHAKRPGALQELLGNVIDRDFDKRAVEFGTAFTTGLGGLERGGDVPRLSNLVGRWREQTVDDRGVLGIHHGFCGIAEAPRMMGIGGKTVLDRPRVRAIY